MDDRSRELDRKYMSIADMEKRIEGQKEMIALLKSANQSDTQIHCELERYETELTNQVLALQKVRREMLEDFLSLHDSNGLTILRMKYMEGLTFDKIAQSLNYTKRWTITLRDRALAEIISEKNKKNSP